MAVIGEDGEVVEWDVETGAVSTLRLRGFIRESSMQLLQNGLAPQPMAFFVHGPRYWETRIPPRCIPLKKYWAWKPEIDLRPYDCEY